MTKTKVLSVFAIVAVAAMMGASSIAPAYAAQKTTNDRVEVHGEFPFSGELCGITSDFTVEQWISGFTTIWDNGHFKFHAELVIIVTDDNNNDADVLTIEAVDNFQGNFNSGETQSIQFNEEGLCADGTTYSSVHQGATLHRDGTITVHNEF